MHLLSVVQAFRENPTDALREYPWFPEQYPKLHTMCQSPNFDMDILKKMLVAKNLLDANELSAHDASVSVGQALVDRYVKPLVPESEPLGPY